MGNTAGRQVLLNLGHGIKLTADGRPEMKHVGVSLDWSTIVAVSGSDVTFTDGVLVSVGEKALRYGQVLTKITNPATDVVTINGSPTGGTFTVTVTTQAGAQTTAGIAYNATAATLQTAIRGLSNVGGTLATVTGSAGGPYTIGFDNSLGAVTVAASGAGLTGGSSPTATVSVTAPGGDVGLYGPFDGAATDGRATLTVGSVYVCNETVKENDLHSNQPPVLYGGLVFQSRLILSAAGAYTGAPVGPTQANLLAVLPRLVLVTD